MTFILILITVNFFHNVCLIMSFISIDFLASSILFLPHNTELKRNKECVHKLNSVTPDSHTSALINKLKWWLKETNTTHFIYWTFDWHECCSYVYWRINKCSLSCNICSRPVNIYIYILFKSDAHLNIHTFYFVKSFLISCRNIFFKSKTEMIILNYGSFLHTKVFKVHMIN